MQKKKKKRKNWVFIDLKSENKSESTEKDTKTLATIAHRFRNKTVDRYRLKRWCKSDNLKAVQKFNKHTLFHVSIPSFHAFPAFRLYVISNTTEHFFFFFNCNDSNKILLNPFFSLMFLIKYRSKTVVALNELKKATAKQKKNSNFGTVYLNYFY